MSILQEMIQISEAKKWTNLVHQKWTPPEGFFTKSAASIASGLKDASDDLKQAMARLTFYVNRAGGNLSAEDAKKLELAKKKLGKLFEEQLVEAKSDKYSEDDDGVKCKFVGVYRSPSRPNQRIPIHQTPNGEYKDLLGNKIVDLKKLVKVS